MSVHQLLKKIVSGGQTGVDRAAFDIALECHIPIGGFCPKGRLAEDGIIPPKYAVTETPLSEHSQRTLWNVRDSDGTLVLSSLEPRGGTALTIRYAKELAKPFLLLPPTKGSLSSFAHWLTTEGISILNVAGPRESEEPGVYDATAQFLRMFFSNGRT
jgi:hypothetical protein